MEVKIIELNQKESNRIESKRIESNRKESNRIERIDTNLIEWKRIQKN